MDNCKKLIPSRAEGKEKSEEVGTHWIAEGFGCEVKKLGLNFLGIEESIWNLDQGECYQSNLGK